MCLILFYFIAESCPQICQRSSACISHPYLLGLHQNIQQKFPVFLRVSQIFDGGFMLLNPKGKYISKILQCRFYTGLYW